MADWEKYENEKDEVVAALVTEDKEFFGILIRRYENRIIAYVRRIGAKNQEAAEDIAQNIFIKAYVNINSFQKDQKFSSWLYGIAHNECIDHWRKNKRHRENISLEGSEDLFALISSGEDLEDEVVARFDSEKTKKMLDNLPVKAREVLVLRYLEDKSYEEISDILRKPVSTVGTMIRRAKKKFKEVLSEKQ